MKPTRYKITSLRSILNALVVLALLTPGAGFAEDPKLDTKEQQITPTAFADEKPKPVFHWGEGDGKSYLVPALSLPAGTLAYSVALLTVTPENATYLAPIIGPDFLGLRWERSF